MTAVLKRPDGGTEVFRHLLARLLTEDDGQDLVEYAFLAAFIGIAGWAVVMTIPNAIGDTYKSWIDPTSGVPALWDPPEPEAAGS
jgi:Flp pilus assembly pilin Flp